MLAAIGKVFLKAIGGSRNERVIRSRMEFATERVNPLEPEMRALLDEQMLVRSMELRHRIQQGESRSEIMPEAFALVREASRRARDHRQFDVQLVAGVILDEGWIAEEATGEGKTVACYPAVYMAYLEGHKVHVVTTNDYLVNRDADFAEPVFALLGVTVGYITSDMPAYGGEADVRRAAYACDITYGMASEFGFDYLRDNMKMSVADQVQGELGFAIIDEADNILIDEARTPLIISGPAYGSVERYRKADGVARELIRKNRSYDQINRRAEALKREVKSLEGAVSKAKGEGAEDARRKLEQTQQQLAEAQNTLARELKHYEIELDKKAVHMTHEGVTAAQEAAGVGSFYVGANMEWPHLMEQSLRAHLVYERDKDYVVRDGSVIIVDSFTGRVLEGRQWSDGLHQGIEAKEDVPIKQETQTIATITYQNFFKLYKKLSGMTGTAITEAEEFMKIFGMDTAVVPTHRPVNRVDHNDKIFADVESKYDALVEEINTVSKSGRPVLVGTTSIEKSERLSEMLTHRYGIEHQVLNARPENAAREAEIVARTGSQRPLKKGSKQMVGTVTIATNMAGRGTDIKLGPGVVYAKCKVPPAEKLEQLGVEAEDLFPPGTTKCCLRCPQYDPATNCAHCFKPKIDSDFPFRGREQCTQEVPCGVHIVGTERHEARRIDNQLRGRSGRQGDPGSGRFFLSLRDELMAVFAGEWTLKVLGWLGLQGDAAIEDRRVSKGIARAQKKVEQRNFEIRKNLLEYDEVMDYQRHTFYAQRQQVLEGRDLKGIVTGMISESVRRAVDNYLDQRYPHRCIAEWARQNLQISIEDDQINATSIDDLPNLEDDLRDRAKDEAAGVITITLGEYMDVDLDRREWDLRGLSGWAMSRFDVNLSQNQLRKMDPPEVELALIEAARERIDQLDLTGVVGYLAEGFGPGALAEWAAGRFSVTVDPADLAGGVEQALAVLMEKVEAAYGRREVECPVEYAIDMTMGQEGTENVYALGNLVTWANRKYDAQMTVDELRGAKPDEIRQRLLDLSQTYLRGQRLGEVISRDIGPDPDIERAIRFAGDRFDTQLEAEDFDSDIMGKLISVGRDYLRREMTELERFVLLQIFDSCWKDHLLAMDHLKSGIGLRSYAEQDPRVAYKREGSRLFQEMLTGIQDKVADMIFKVRLTAGAEMANVYQVSNLIHEQLTGYDHLAQEMAQRQQADAAQSQRVKTIVRDVPKVGRNDPCPCGSGKKYKKCCGRGL